MGNHPGFVMHCRAVTDTSAFYALDAEWRQLFCEAVYPTPFASWEWARAWWQVFGTSYTRGSASFTLLVVAVYARRGQQEELVGLAPCYYPSYPDPPGQPRILRQFGDTGSVGDSVTEERVVLIKREWQEEVTFSLVSFLRHNTLSTGWDIFCLRFPVSCPTPLPSRLFGTSSVAQGLYQAQTISTEILDLPDRWETYRKGLSKSMRDNIAYYPRLLTRRGYDWRIRTVTDPGEMSHGLSHLVHLHTMRSESERGIPHANHLADAEHRAFLNASLPALAAANMARILLLEVGAHAVGALCLLENAGMQTIYYSGFDPAFYDQSPLTILNTEAIRSAIERGVRQINYLPGTSRWNARWGSQSQPLLRQVLGLRMELKSAWRTAFHLVSRVTAGNPQSGRSAASKPKVSCRNGGMEAL